MSEILCVTNRALCTEPFLERIRKVAAARPAGIILREKDLPSADYLALARAVADLCAAEHCRCILHTFAADAIALGVDAVHLPLDVLRGMPDAQKRHFSILGASCHSVAEAREAQALGCTYLTAGHIFETDCKKGLPGRGLAFLHEVCRSVSVPVYAIGGIGAGNLASVLEAGAAGACVMSGAMRCGDPAAYFAELKRAGDER